MFPVVVVRRRRRLSRLSVAINNINWIVKRQIDAALALAYVALAAVVIKRQRQTGRVTWTISRVLRLRRTFRKFKNLLQQTQTFLFGDQLDLAFVLAHKPACVFPYEAPVCVDAPSHCLQSLVNIRKDTLKLVKCKDTLDSMQSHTTNTTTNTTNNNNNQIQTGKFYTKNKIMHLYLVPGTT